MQESRHTHSVAVNSYLIKNNQFLLLKRSTPPFMWGPPGGRLKVNEDPVAGLKREVWEETKLEIEILMPVTTWFGQFNNRQILSIDYLCKYKNSKVKLSSEHESYVWQTIHEMEKNQDMYFTKVVGFQLKDFRHAWHIFQAMNY